MPEWSIWTSFYDYKDSIHTYEPKFSNNIGTLKLRPDTNDKNFSNLYHATAYTKTTANIFNMESAVEAGVKAAAAIKKETLQHPEECWFMRFIRWMDDLLFVCI